MLQLLLPGLTIHNWTHNGTLLMHRASRVWMILKSMKSKKKEDTLTLMSSLVPLRSYLDMKQRFSVSLKNIFIWTKRFGTVLMALAISTFVTRKISK